VAAARAGGHRRRQVDAQWTIRICARGGKNVFYYILSSQSLPGAFLNAPHPGVRTACVVVAFEVLLHSTISVLDPTWLIILHLILKSRWGRDGQQCHPA
jgi:hypothetical protein